MERKQFVAASRMVTAGFVVVATTVALAMNVRAQTIVQAVDANAYAPTWTTGGGGGSFIGQKLVSHDGVDAAQSPVIDAGKESYIQTTVTGPAVIRFWWKRSGDEGDATAFVDAGIDSSVSDDSGVLESLDSLESSSSSVFDWRQVTVALSHVGPQVVRIGLHQNVQTGLTKDQLWVDEVAVAPEVLAYPVFMESPAFVGASLGTPVSLQGIVFPGADLYLKWQRNTVDYTTGTVTNSWLGGYGTSSLDIAALAAGDAGAYRVWSSYSPMEGGGANVYYSRASTVSVVPYETALDTALTGWSSYAYGPGGVVAANQSTDTHDGVDAVALSNSSGVSGDLRGAIAGPGTVKFWWKHSGPASGPAARFTAWNDNSDYHQVIEMAPNSGWKQEQMVINEPNGASISWELLTDGTLPTSDKLVIDQFSFTAIDQGPPVIIAQPQSQGLDVGETALLVVEAGGLPPLTYQWTKNGQNIPGAQLPTLTLPSVNTGSIGSYACKVTNGQGNVTTRPANLTTVSITAALDAGDGQWHTEGDVFWQRESTVKKTGFSALASGAIGDRQTSTLSGTFTGPGTLSFWEKISSEQAFDLLQVFVDGVKQSEISGTVDWKQQTITLDAGVHRVDWTYRKDLNGKAGSDTAWIDGVVLTGAATALPVVSQQPQPYGAESGAFVVLEIRATGGGLKYQWQKNGVNMKGENGRALTLPSVATTSAGTYRCVVTNSFGTATSDTASLSLISNAGASLDDLTRKWVSFGEGLWSSQTTVTHDGVDALKSGALGNSQASKLFGTFAGPATIKFWRKVSSEAGGDFFRFYVDGGLVAEASGEADWQEISVIVGAGQHDVLWSYEKNASNQAGQDAAWLDQVSVGPPFSITQQPQSLLLKAGSPAAFSLQTAGLPTTCQWKKAAVSLSGATSTGISLPAVTVTDGGQYSAVIGGVLPTNPATLAVVGDAKPVNTIQGAKAVFAIPNGGGGGAVTFEWRREMSVLQESGHLVGTGSPTLSIVGSSSTDNGSYYCTVKGFGTTLILGPYPLFVLDRPVITTASVPAAIVSGALNWQQTALPSPAGFIITGLPSGLSFNAATGLISGTPNVSGSFQVKVSAKNAAGTGAVQPFTLVIGKLPDGTTGSFTAWLSRRGAINASLGGYLALNVTSTGSCTGTLKNGSGSYPLPLGRLVAPVTGSPTLTLSIPHTALVLNLSFDGPGNSVTGTLKDTTLVGDGGSLVAGRRLLWNGTAAIAYAASYNSAVDLPPASLNDSAQPLGVGWQQMTVTAAGVANGSGRTAEGVSYTFGGGLWPDGSLPQFVLIDLAKGSVMGLPRITLGATVPDNRIVGWVDGIKNGPINAADHTYASGIPYLERTIDGAPWIKPTAAFPVVLKRADAPDNASIAFTKGGVETAAQFTPVNHLDQTFRITKTNAATFLTKTTGNPCVVAMTIVPSTGLFSGSFTLTDTVAGQAVSRPVSYSGILLSHKGKGFGYFTLQGLAPSPAAPPILGGRVVVN